METEGQLSFEYAGEDTTPGEGNGLLLFVNSEFTDLPYVSPSSADATAATTTEAWQWRAYSRFLPAGELLLVWSYHQDNGTAGASRVRTTARTTAHVSNRRRACVVAGDGAPDSDTGREQRRRGRVEPQDVRRGNV